MKESKKSWTVTSLKEPWNTIIMITGGLFIGHIIGQILIHFIKHK